MCTILKGHFGVALNTGVTETQVKNMRWKHTVEPMPLSSNSGTLFGVVRVTKIN